MNTVRRYIHDPVERGPARSGQRNGRTRKLIAGLLVSGGALALSSAPAFGEGSVDINTGADGSSRHGLVMASTGNYGGPGSDPYTVLHVYAQAGETIQLGSSAMALPGTNIQVYNQGTNLEGLAYPGAPAFANDVFDCRTDDPGTGVIADGAAGRAQELAGPEASPDGNPDTWVACEFTPTTSGIYPIIIGSPRPTGSASSATVGLPDQLSVAQNVAIWDVTVRNASGSVQPGRLFSDQFAFWETLNPSGDVRVFPYTRTGYEYQVDMFNHNGAGWSLRADDQGIVNTATGERLFASFDCRLNPGDTTNVCSDTRGDFAAKDARYPLFVNRPDPIAISGPGGLAATRGYATSPITPASRPLTGTFTGSGRQTDATNHGTGGTFAVTSPALMAGLGSTLEIDVNRNGTFGDGPDYVDTEDLEADGTNTYTWNGRDATGSALQCGDFPYRVRSTLAEVHFPMYDVETSGGTQIQRLTLPDDATLGDKFAASYNDLDPFKNRRVTDADPTSEDNVVSDSTFHAWGDPANGADPGGGDTDYIDTWAKLPEVQATGTLRILCADLTIDKRATQSPAFPDQNLTYDLVVRNNGPDAAQNVVMTDALPANVSYVSSSSGCTVGGTIVTCRLPSLAVGASHTFQVTVRVAASATGTLTNAAEVRSDTPDPDPRNRDEERVPVEPLADLAIAKRALSNRLVPGRELEYELVVTNHGPSTARDVRMSDPLPRGLSFVSASRGCTFASGTVTCTAASLDSGRSLTYRVVTRVAANVTENSVTNTATVESTTRDPDRTNNRDDERVPSGPEADLSITKTPSVDRVVVGGQLFYTLVIRNDGPSDAQDVVVTDTAGAGLTLLSAQGSPGVSCSLAANRVTCRVGTLAVGGATQVLVSARAEQVGVLTNQATVDSPTEDPREPNNRTVTRVPSDPGPLPQPADLEIVKTSNRRAVLGSGNITYTLRVRNLGPGVSTGVQVIDTPSLPVKVVSIRSTVGRCTTSIPIRCDLGSLRVGARVTVRIVAQPMAPGTLRNSASVTGDVPDPNARNNIDGTATRVQGLLRIRKTASTSRIRAGGSLSYRITVTNASGFALRSVRVCDDLPSGLVFASASPKATQSKGQHCWTVRTLGAKKSKTFTVRVRVLRGTSGRKVNTATATAPNARGVRSRAAADTAPIQVIAGVVRAGGVTG